MRRRLLGLTLLLPLVGCSAPAGGIASNACPDTFRSVDASAPLELLGGETPDDRLAATETTVPLTWADDGTTTTATLTLTSLDDADVYEGEDCDPYAGLLVHLRIQTADGRFDHALVSAAYLGVDGSAFTGAASVAALEWDPGEWTESYDPVNAELKVQWGLPLGSAPEGRLTLDPGYDGEDIEVATW
ncbi:MAG: hypothetical protein VYE22_01395 [Myxococcota bacterium]|nr:hypothetical protein [Myxococcota bacterium]